MKRKGKSKINKPKKSTKPFEKRDTLWVKEALKKNGIDLEKEERMIKERAEKFKNDPKISEIQKAFSIIINEIIDKDIPKANFYAYLMKRLKEFSQSKKMVSPVKSPSKDPKIL